mgnify:CR=1 FL=1
MSFAFRRVSSMRKVMWASLAINLFLAGALAGNLVSGFSMFHFFMPPPPPSAFENEPPGVRMLKNVRSRLSPEGKVIFDAEFDGVINDIKGRPSPFLLTVELRETRRFAHSQDYVREVLRQAAGLFPLRIAGHYGLAHWLTGPDALVGRSIGELNAIAQSTIPGTLTVSESFASALFLATPEGLFAEPVGEAGEFCMAPLSQAFIACFLCGAIVGNELLRIGWSVVWVIHIQ